MKPLAIDLCCGLGGWSSGLLAEGWEVVGFDLENHRYGVHQYPAQLVLQDILTLDGKQFRGKASLIVASPPCQKYSYMAMPWSRAKLLREWYRDPLHPERIADLNALYDACVRIGKEAGCPIVIENVRGAQSWIGRARWNFGSYYLWGDVPALMPHTLKVPAKRAMDDLKYGQRKLLHSHLPVGDGPLGRNDGTEAIKVPRSPPFGWGESGLQEAVRSDPSLADGLADGSGRKPPGFRFDGSGRSFQTASAEGTKQERDAAFVNRVRPGMTENSGGNYWFQSGASSYGSKSSARKAASAMIAKIPESLARHIAAVYYPRDA